MLDASWKHRVPKQIQVFVGVIGPSLFEAPAIYIVLVPCTHTYIHIYIYMHIHLLKNYSYRRAPFCHQVGSHLKGNTSLGPPTSNPPRPLGKGGPAAKARERERDTRREVFAS